MTGLRLTENVPLVPICSANTVVHSIQSMAHLMANGMRNLEEK